MLYNFTDQKDLWPTLIRWFYATKMQFHGESNYLNLAIGCASGINYSVLFICATYKSLQLLDPSLWGYAISEALEWMKD